MAGFTGAIYRGLVHSWEDSCHAADLSRCCGLASSRTSRRRGPMTGGRWSSQTRFTVVLVGLALVALGVLTTMQFRSTAGAAALVAAGVLVGLAGLSGGTIVVRSTDREERLASAGKAQLEGDAEG